MSLAETLDMLLLQDGAVTAAQASHARILNASTGGFLGDQFVSLGYITQERLVLALSRQLGLPIADDNEVIVASRALSTLVPSAWVRQFRGVPFHDEPDVLHIAIYDPASRRGFPQLEALVRKDVTVFVASEPVVESAIARLYPLLAHKPKAPTAPLMSETPRAVTMGMPAVPPPKSGPLAVPRQVTMLKMPAVVGPPPTGLSDAIKAAFPEVQSQPEIPNENFGAALNLEEEPPKEPELLFRKKPTPVPILLTRKKEPIKRIGSVGEAAELCFSSETLPKMAAAAVGFLMNFFPRVAVFDLAKHPSDVVSSTGFKHDPAQWNLAGMSLVQELLTSRSSFYGPTQAAPDWAPFHTAVGDDPPESLLLLPVLKEGEPRVLLYADAPTHERYDDIRDMETLAREMGMALEALGV